MQHKMHTIWVTFITLIALLLPSAVTSAPLLPSQMLSANQMTMATSSNDSNCVFITENTVSEEKIECCNSDSLMSEHQCCPASGVASYAVISAPITSYHQPYSLVLISRESARRASTVADTLFRPPIA